jgi:hypothetical protein
MSLRLSTIWPRLAIFLSLLSLLGCISREDSITQTPAISLAIDTFTVESTQNKPSPSPVITSSIAPFFEPTQTLTPSSTCTRTPKPSLTTTWTPLPTLSSQESKNLIQELYETNADCSFPCWWGITPEKTAWVTAKQFLSQFSTVKEGQKYFYTEAGKQHIRTSASYSYDFEGTEGGALFTIRDGIVTTISVYPSNGSYTIHRLLKEYGQPPEVYIKAFQDAPEGNPPFYLIINYPDLGTEALYASIANRISNDQLRGCFDKIEPELIFDPRIKTMTFYEMADLLFGTNPTVYPKPIDEATKMDVNSFYQFALTNDQICIDTPSELWP